MKVFTETRMDMLLEGRAPMPHEHHRIERPILPHERRMMMHIEFGEDDLTLLDTVFGDPDTAQAAAYIIQDAPPEIQILAVQLMKMSGSPTFLATNSDTNSQVKFPSPALNEATQGLYEKLYGDAGTRFVSILNTCPNEIAVISTLIAYLDNKTKEEL